MLSGCKKTFKMDNEHKKGEQMFICSFLSEHPNFNLMMLELLICGYLMFLIAF